MKSLILILAFVWAATAPLPKRTRFYFWVQVMGALAMEGVILLGYQVNANLYELFYTICTMGILASGFYLTWEALRVYGLPYRLLLFLEGLVYAGFMTYLAAYAVLHDYHAFPYFLYLTLGEATLLVISGGVLAATAPLLIGRDRFLAAALATAWILKAAILYAYSINVLGNRTLWMELGSYLPALLFTTVCAYIGRKARLIEANAEART